MTEYVIIGAGPAGLAFACGLMRRGIRDFLIVDMGKPVGEREHDAGGDLACGAGGAGLFSDGKLSFWTKLLNHV